MKKKKSLPRDTAQRARAVFDIAIGESDADDTKAEQKNPHFKSLSDKGASKGGLSRAAKLTPEQRKEIARKAAKARWER